MNLNTTLSYTKSVSNSKTQTTPSKFLLLFSYHRRTYNICLFGQNTQTTQGFTHIIGNFKKETEKKVEEKVLKKNRKEEGREKEEEVKGENLPAPLWYNQTHTVINYRQGGYCFGKAASRQSKVILQCADVEETKIERITEPETCKYEIYFSSPYACRVENSYIEDLQK